MLGTIIGWVTGREPVVSGFTVAVLALAVAFGVDLTDAQVAAIGAVVSAGLALAVRRVVTPVAKVGPPLLLAFALAVAVPTHRDDHGGREDCERSHACSDDDFSPRFDESPVSITICPEGCW